MGREDYIYLRSLFKKLLLNREKYFDGDYVNSDGRRILEDLLRIVLKNYPWYRRRVYRVRRNPCIYNIVKLGEEVIGADVHEWFINGFYEPFHYF